MIEEILLLEWQEVRKSAAMKRELNSLYKKINGSDSCCEDVTEQFFIKQRRKLAMKKNNPVSSCNYKLKEGSLVRLPSKGIHVTNANLTDEYAEELLLDSRNKKHFEVVAETTEHVLDFGGIAEKNEAEEKTSNVYPEKVREEIERSPGPVEPKKKYSGKKKKKR